MKGVAICTLAMACLTFSHTNGMKPCKNVMKEIQEVFQWCAGEKTCAEGIATRLGFCFQDRKWMAAVWRPILSKENACYYCNKDAQACGCYSGTYKGPVMQYEFMVTSSDCKGIQQIPKLPPTNGVDACLLVDYIRFIFHQQGTISLCSAGAVRFEINKAAGVWVASSEGTGDCLREQIVPQGGVYVWAFR